MRRPAWTFVAVFLGACLPSEHTNSFPRSGRAEMMVPDFLTSLDSGDNLRTGVYGAAAVEGPGLIVALGGVSVDSSMLPAHLTVTRLADGQLVSGEVRDGWWDTRGNEGDFSGMELAGLSFLPSVALGPGWHVMRLDLQPWVDQGATLTFGAAASLAGAHEGNVLYARFRVDSRPVWHATQLSCAVAHPPDPPTNQDCALVGLISESVPDWGDSQAEVLFDGAPALCPTVLFGSDTLGFLCPSPRLGADIEIRLMSDAVTDPAGRRESSQHVMATRDFTGDLIQVNPRFGMDIANAASAR